MSSVLKLALILLSAALLAIGARSLYVRSLAAQPAPEPDVRVRVAAADLPAGLLLRDADLAWQALAPSQVPQGALIEHAAQSELNGSLLRHPVQTGTVLKAADVIRPDAPGFLAAALQPGMRAVSVPVNDVSGNAGLIQPGDYVDMILTQRMGAGRASSAAANLTRVVSETVVERARIIAVGTSFQRETEAAKANRARTVTLEVPPRAAEAVTVAAELGNLSMVLRSFAITDRNADDAAGASVVAWESSTQALAAKPVWGSDVSRVLTTPPEDSSPSATPHLPRRIVIMRGQTKQEQELSPYAR